MVRTVEEIFSEIFAEVNQGKKIDPDTLLALRAVLDTLQLPYFVAVYVGIPEGGKLIVSKQQAEETMANLWKEVENNRVNDPEISKVWD